MLKFEEFIVPYAYSYKRRNNVDLYSRCLQIIKSLELSFWAHYNIFDSHGYDENGISFRFGLQEAPRPKPIYREQSQ